jgi:regulator of protease activity HflC (stomatin/prohibitin superfamily)
MTIAQFIAEMVQLLWPFRVVAQWEFGLLYRNGRFVRVLEPGVYFVIPWFWTVNEINKSRGIVGTGRKDITTKDGGTLSFEATAPVWVRDPATAINTVDEVRETAQELFSSVLSERLADVDASRLTPESRGRLVADLLRWVNTEAAEFGLEFGRVRFTSFVRNARTVRLLMDQNTIANW